jgi:hypothetical protein
LATGKDAGLDQEAHQHLGPPTTRGLIHESADLNIWHADAADVKQPVLLTTPQRPSSLLKRIIVN